jgi:hypothetical protein
MRNIKLKMKAVEKDGRIEVSGNAPWQDQVNFSILVRRLSRGKQIHLCSDALCNN